jgi:hypothetical protein
MEAAYLVLLIASLLVIAAVSCYVLRKVLAGQW